MQCVGHGIGCGNSIVLQIVDQRLHQLKQMVQPVNMIISEGARNVRQELVFEKLPEVCVASSDGPATKIYAHNDLAPLGRADRLA